MTKLKHFLSNNFLYYRVCQFSSYLIEYHKYPFKYKVTEEDINISGIECTQRKYEFNIFCINGVRYRTFVKDFKQVEFDYLNKLVQKNKKKKIVKLLKKEIGDIYNGKFI